ncbi:protochlorophyllide reductase [Polynucleobacter sp. UB-Siik-W21]|uniref:protochlorophyllide reductase n=1 Tax=Polynucleobacter sp. UB-Siik-W21 TaxID=1855646 RepID=UPI001BFE8B1D|nr:protochlorophyllide reductase [Polynucleobacter sp. UB-Siik-W21]QWD69859.1 protochlorophyllide reductase [Polynucleobacter sp. UB-Siik-W21]
MPANTTQPLAIITGASSGVGLYAAKALLARHWRLILAVRDPQKMELSAKAHQFDSSQYEIWQLDLGNLDSVKAFVQRFNESGQKLNALLCNAATYLPLLKEPARSPQGFEISVATNYFGHYVLSRMLLDKLIQTAKQYEHARLITLGTVTANSEEFGGKVPIPAPADIGALEGLMAGFKAPIAMINGKPFKPGKAYKDSKLCNMVMNRELQKRYHASTGVIFNTLYPGCVAETALFRDTPPLFQKIFPWFQKNITKGYVSQELAGERVAQVVADPRFTQSGVHWSWGNRNSAIREPFAQELSMKAKSEKLSKDLWEITAKLVGMPSD